MSRETKDHEPIEPHEIEAFGSEPPALFPRMAVLLIALLVAAAYCLALGLVESMEAYFTGVK